MSCGFVCVLFSYISVVGDVLLVCFFGMIVLRIFVCCFGSCFESSSCFASESLLSSVIFFLSFFLYCLCFCMLFCVGLLNLFSCSSCCFCIFRLYRGAHHVFLRFPGVFSYFSIVRCIATCMFMKCSDVVVCGLASVMAFSIAVSVSCMMVLFCSLYLAVDSDLFLFVFLGMGLCRMV